MPALTRRRALAGAGVVAAGALGAVAGLLRPAGRRTRSTARPTTSPPPTPPAPLVSALDREERLVAALEASATAAPAAVMTALVDDHRAHADAVRSLLTPYRTSDSASSSAPGTSGSSAPPSAAVSLAVLRSQEALAARAAGAESAALTGAAAAVLASIAACEAGHAALLSSVG